MMESLQLPYWMEETITSSPATYQIANEELQLFDNFATTPENDFLLSNDVSVVTDINAVTSYNNSSSTNKNMILQDKPKTAHDLLLELDQEIQNEPSWYQNPKLDFIYEQLSPVSGQTSPTQNMSIEEIQLQQNTEELLSEFDTVCNAVGLQLTPPATPPMSPKISPDYVTGAPIVYVFTLDNNNMDLQQEIPAQDLIIQDDILSEANDESMDLIDELVREHTTNLPCDLSSIIDDSSSIADSQTSDNVSVISFDASDSNYSPSRSDDASSYASFMSPRSSDSFDVAGYDEDWTPSVDKKKTLKKSSTRSSKASEPKREKRGYGRPLHEKKARKKEQNKNAATRYRQKKKEQLKVVLSEEDQLLQVHSNLMAKHDDVKREIRCLKKLMKEILTAKGVL